MLVMNAIVENRLLSRWADLLPRAPRSSGEVHESDCELVKLDGERMLALTVDTIDEEVRLGLYRDQETAGRIAAVATLSDLAAVGADPIGLLLSVSLPPGDPEPVQRRVAAGVARACALAGTFVLGGDTSESDGLRISCVGAGLVPVKGALRRVGMRPGDVLFASGPLGAGAALGAARWLLPEDAFPEGSFHPLPRIAHGRALRGIASACMDTSDGLVATLDQLARLNGVAVRIEVPLASLLLPAVEELRRGLGVGALPFLAAHHGEFELVFSVPERLVDGLRARADALGWSPLRLGRVEHGQGLWLGDRALDGAAIRNLLHAVGGDPARYVRALLELA